MRASRILLLRGTQPLLVISVESSDPLPPNRPPDLSKSGPWLRERMVQMRAGLGMTEAEIDSMLAQQRGVNAPPGSADTAAGAEGQPSKESTVAAAPDSSKEVAAGEAHTRQPTWKEIVEHREREGKLYAPRTIREAFPYLTGQPAGVPEFQDKLRREQLMAHTSAQSNNPMDVMQELQRQRVHWVAKSILSCIIGFSFVQTYLWWHEHDADPELAPEKFYLSKDDAYRRVNMQEEPLVPVLQGSMQGYKCVWVPQSKCQHMMWHNRFGAPYADGMRSTFFNGGMASNMNRDNNYIFPGHLADLVGYPGQQLEYQRLMRAQLEQQAGFRRGQEAVPS
eukprot:TRINITY_DN65651_c0_g1_i1.p1 TRINITY_DN65651_c0_g1~~TRINITY_DN65651_c0_g1_i1.p1  ORF type:complete len:337 (+),score=115.30 TRINITY_DN65651_c0_g1_i1:79-1089(+)